MLANAAKRQPKLSSPRHRDGSFDRFAVDPFTLLRGNYTACDDARARQQEGSLKLGEIVLVYRDRRLVTS